MNYAFYILYNYILLNEVNKTESKHINLSFIFLTPVFTVTRTDAEKERANHQCNSNWETKNSMKKVYKTRDKTSQYCFTCKTQLDPHRL